MIIHLLFYILLFLVILSALYYFLLNRERKSLDETTRGLLKSDFITLEQGTVHYEYAGKNEQPLVVLVHGFSTPAYIWDPTYQSLINAGFRVLRFDLYGRGTSDRPKVDYELDLFVRQLALLIDALQIKGPFHLVGLSMGGPIATAYSNQYPDSVHSLTLIDPLVSNIFQSGIFPLNIKGIGEIFMALVAAPFILPKSQAGDFHHPEAFPDWQNHYKDQMQYKGFRRAILSTMRCMSKTETIQEYQNFGQMGFPTLILWGEEDQTISAEDINLLRKLIPHHHFHAIQDAGHIPHYEKAEVVNPILIDFLIKS
jgi:pimeloyl-ACP methyl ester carboxylesterase